MSQKLQPALTPRCRIDESAHGGDAIGRKAYASGVFVNGRLVGGEVDAVHLVAGYVSYGATGSRDPFPSER